MQYDQFHVVLDNRIWTSYIRTTKEQPDWLNHIDLILRNPTVTRLCKYMVKRGWWVGRCEPGGVELDEGTAVLADLLLKGGFSEDHNVVSIGERQSGEGGGSDDEDEDHGLAGGLGGHHGCELPRFGRG